MRIRDDPENHRYVAEVDGAVAGMAVYHLRANRHIFVHTEVGAGYEGHGVGSALARFALDDVAARGGTVVPVCPFIAGWIARHPEYGEIVDQQLLDRINGVTGADTD
jgi:uncharacterized protein